MKVENHVSVHSNLNLNGFSNSGGTDRTHRTANLGKEVILRRMVIWWVWDCGGNTSCNFRFHDISNIRFLSSKKAVGEARRGGTASVKLLMNWRWWWRTIRMLLSVNKHILVLIIIYQHRWANKFCLFLFPFLLHLVFYHPSKLPGIYALTSLHGSLLPPTNSFPIPMACN